MATLKKVNEDLDGLLSKLKRRASAINDDEYRPKKRRRLNEERKEPENEPKPAEPVLSPKRYYTICPNPYSVKSLAKIARFGLSQESYDAVVAGFKLNSHKLFDMWLHGLRASGNKAMFSHFRSSFDARERGKRLWKFLAESKYKEKVNPLIASQIRCFEEDFEIYPWRVEILRDIKKRLVDKNFDRNQRVRVYQRIRQGPSGNTTFGRYLDDKYEHVRYITSSKTVAWWRSCFVEDRNVTRPSVLVLDVQFCPLRWNWRIICEIANGKVSLANGCTCIFYPPTIIIFTQFDLSRIQSLHRFCRSWGYITKKENKWILE